MRFELIDDIDAIASDWQEMSRYADNPFAGYPWVTAWYEANSGVAGVSPIVVAGRDEAGQLHYLLPLVRRRFLIIRTLTTPGHAHRPYFSDLQSPRFRSWLAAGNQQHMATTVRHLLSGIGDILVVEGLEGSALSTHHAPLTSLLESQKQCAKPAYRVNIESDWQRQYERNTNAKARSNDRRCRRRLEELGTVTFRINPPLAQRRQWMSRMLEMKISDLNRKAVLHRLGHPISHRFYQALLTRYANASEDDLLIMALCLDDEPIAMSLGLVHDNVLFGLILAMDHQRYGRYAPGRLLLLEINAFLASQGITGHDYGVGNETFKAESGGERHLRYRGISSYSLRGRLMAYLYDHQDEIKHHIRNFPLVRDLAPRLNRLGST